MFVVSYPPPRSHIRSRSSQGLSCINSDGAIRCVLSGRKCHYILWLDRLTQHSRYVCHDAPSSYRNEMLAAYARGTFLGWG
jgi:hypothetical protein